MLVMSVVCVIICFDCSSIWLVPALLWHTDINNNLLCTSWLGRQDSAGLCCRGGFQRRAGMHFAFCIVHIYRSCIIYESAYTHMSMKLHYHAPNFITLLLCIMPHIVHIWLSMFGVYVCTYVCMYAYVCIYVCVCVCIVESCLNLPHMIEHVLCICLC